MTQSPDLLEKMTLPYYAHRQAQIVSPLHSIAWNKVAISGYIDIAILLKSLEPPGSFLRKIRSFYESYDKIDVTSPLLGDLDAISRNLAHLDKANPKAVTTFALQWNNVGRALERFCMELISKQRLNNIEQIEETLQTNLFALQGRNALPRWDELLEQQQFEITKMVQLKNWSVAALTKINFKYQFDSGFHTDQLWLKTFIQNSAETNDIIHVLNKNFLRLINLINENIPEPDRHIKTTPSKQGSTPTQDYRFILQYLYDGNDEGEYETNFFTLLRNFLK